MPIINQTIDNFQILTFGKTDGYVIDNSIHFYHHVHVGLPKARIDEMLRRFDKLCVELAYLANDSGFIPSDRTIDAPVPRGPIEFTEMARSIVNRHGVVDVEHLIDDLKVLVGMTRDIDAIIPYDDISTEDHQAKSAMDAFFDVKLVKRLLKQAQRRVFRSVRISYGFKNLPIG